MRRRSKLLSVSLVVLLLGTAEGGTAQAAATPAGEIADLSRTVTLITGDRVTVLGNGAVSVRPGPGRDKIPMLTSTAAGHVKVIPADALPSLRADRLDARLFDVTGLLTAGYDDRRADLPLIVGDAAGATGTVVRRLSSVKATAVRTRKRDLGRQWGAGRAAKGRTGKVWLDAVGHFTGAEGVQQIGAPAAWKAGLTGAGITVGVIDSGVDVTHPDLAGRVAAQLDFSPLAEGGTPTTEDIHDYDGHGTHVASILAGSGAASDGRYRGVAPDVRLVSAKVGDDVTTQSSVIAAMEWAAGTEHAKVVNMSLGFPDTPGADPIETALNDLTAQHGTLFVVASGNDGKNSNGPNNGNDYSILSPASAAGALSVGAVDHDNQLADFSSRGPGLDGDIIKPEITAPGVDVTGALSKDSYRYDGQPYDTGYGTSYAAPHAAGSAAILAQRHPDWGPELLKSALMGSARPTPGIGVFAQGAGRVDIPAALGTSLLADPPAVSLGKQAWPHTGNAPITRTVTYRNPGPKPLTVALRLDVAAPGGAPAPTGLFTLSTTALTVPGGGTAQARVTANASATAPDGPYSGQLTATAKGRAVRTPVGLIREAEFHDLTLHIVGRDGQTPEEFYTQVIGLDTPYLHDTLADYPWLPDVTLRVPKGRYAIVSRIAGQDGDDWASTVLAQPSLSVTKDTDLTLDARIAQPVQVTVPEAGAVRASGAVDIGVRGLSGWLSTGIRTSGTTRAYTAQLGANVAGDAFVSSVRAAFSDGADPSAYAYQLGWVQPGTLPSGFTRSVTAGELATEQVSVRRQLPVSEAELEATMVIPGYPLTTIATSTPPAGELRVNGAGGVQWASGVYEWQDDVGGYAETHTVGSPVAYQAGRTYTSAWNAPVIAPCLPPGSGVAWADGVLTVRVPMTCDGAGHPSTIYPTTGTTTLLRDGKEVATSDVGGRATFSLRPESGKYRLHTEATRAAPFETSTRTTADWTFTDPAVLPDLYTVRLTPVLDDAAPAGGAFTIPMVTAARVKAVGLEVSYDDGATWQAAGVKHTGAGSWEGKVVHPSTGGYASLRVTASGGGSKVVQTVLRAYRIKV
ncbi:MAG: S8 family serine peptidase [Actinoplanes sp.]